jgi:hypothetical protein
MSTRNALDFIDRGLRDRELRGRLNHATTLAERDDVLAGEKLAFSPPEFEEAFYQRLTQCQETVQAEQLKEFKAWWDLLAQSFQPAPCGGQCAGCAT